MLNLFFAIAGNVTIACYLFGPLDLVYRLNTEFFCHQIFQPLIVYLRYLLYVFTVAK